MAKNKKSRSISVDFTGVEAGGGSNVPEGQYEVKVVEVEQKTSDNSGNDYLAWEFQVISPAKYKGKKLYHNTSLTPQSLWNLRGLLEQLGVEVPEEPTDIDLDDLIDRTVGCEVQHEEYKGKPKPRIVDFFEFSEEEAEDEKPTKGKKSKAEPEEEEEAEEEEPKKKSKKERREERKAKKKAPELTEADVLEKDENELGELIEEHDLDVDLNDFNTLRRKRAAVVEAMDEKGLLADAEEA